MKYTDCLKCGETSPRWSFFGNTLAAIFKVLIGTLTGSKGLVADGVHSLADAISSLFIMVALKVADRPHDEKHPYGYGKIEYVSTISASLFLFAGAGAIFIEALKTFKHGGHELPGNAALLATVISLCFSYLMYISNTCAGTQLGSPAILADANESKADSITSVAVLLGLIGGKLGYPSADTFAAIIVSLFIFNMSVEMFLQGTNGLIDMSVDPEVMQEIVATSMKVEGVAGVKSLKTRQMGQKNWVDIEISVSKKLSVFEVHGIIEKVREMIMSDVDGIRGISVSTYPIS
ncbi:MAG: cation diffusion facilitator family transporter [Desulfobulbaceae bacterium]|nr:cation diffusion facilitator family transporter [Desulfobulbaceae bacterium]HIJ90557.1 cation transporter [Deltaproteobacteria bacterium]